MFRQDGSCPALLEDLSAGFPYGAVTRSGSPFQTLPVPSKKATGLIRVRSPLLTESLLMSFPPATEMFQFAGFASCAYGFSAGYPLRGGLPHSEIPGSTIARISPGLFAACHVLHRLSVPRHPPDALHSRLSATPNGKNHIRRSDSFADATGETERFAESGRDATSANSVASLVTRRDKLSSQKTLTVSARRNHAVSPRRIPPRSHNSLLHNFPSTSATGGQSTLR
jgi:hypothetical protein